MKTDMNLKISIAMTCYNRGKYIKDAIKSIYQQEYTNWELIIVEDKSTDNSLDIINKCIKEFNIEDRTKLITNAENMGYGYSLGKAITESSGELVAILDSDDALSDNNVFTIVVNAHVNNPNVSMTYSNYNECDEKLNKIKVHKTRQLKPSESFLTMGAKLKISHLKVIKKRCYDMTPGINPALKQTVDKDLILKIEEVGSLLYIDEILLNYRFHNDNISRITKSKGIEYQNFVNKTRIQMFRAAKKRRKSL